MKTSVVSFTAALSLLPTFTTALVGIDWKVSGAPASGLKDVTFPFSLANAPHKSGYFFAQQFSFSGQSDAGYTGFQPRPDSGGGPIIHAVFSSFIQGTTTSDVNCHDGADGILNTQGTTWSATVVNTATKLRIPVGSYMLPAGTGGITGSQVGFVEYYPWNAATHTCSSLPYTWVTFGIPTTLSGGSGSLGDAYEYGDCVGKVGFQTSRTSLGVQVDVGF
ncbi:hypothetical protein BS47DRAFT_1378217 [Hydnum rufescens UP504]|uniref:Secreted protein n=1 Tax=Hydnum rufescens UP504 TaxID=1448309 RepID=A0A9P6AID2_9AGAM|nr:hypothetical protein BS47DRAFT_1378217 [Hydnum rufescens UP504]